MKSVLADGVRVCYLQAGRGSPLVLLHGNSLCARSFQPVLDGELATTNHLIAVDLPGHGESGRAPDPSWYTLSGYRRAVARTLDELGLEGVVLVGHSLGGHVALASLDLPRVRGAVVFGTPPLRATESLAEAFTMPPGSEAFYTEELSEDQARAVARLLAGVEHEAVVAEWLLATDGTARTAFVASLQRYVPDEVAAIEDAAKPVMLAHGEGDPLVSGEYLDGLPLSLFWRGRVVTISRGGHAPQLSAPARLASAVAEFLADLER